MTRIYVVTDGIYSDTRIEGASTSLVDAVKIVADKACGDFPAIEVFEGVNKIEGEGLLQFMYCNLENGKISATIRGDINKIPENINVPPIVKVFPDANQSPAVFAIGTGRRKVSRAFRNTLAAEAAKRGWVRKCG